jgi:hypothetical protein
MGGHLRRACDPQATHGAADGGLRAAAGKRRGSAWLPL